MKKGIRATVKLTGIKILVHKDREAMKYINLFKTHETYYPNELIFH